MLTCRETIVLLIVVIVCADFSKATRVMRCKTGKFYENPNEVKISSCDGPPCILKQKSTIEVEQKFILDKDVNTLTTSVHAIILGLPVPFLGVNGVTACDRIYNADGSKAGCPLFAGKEYVYKNSFPVLSAYPRINVNVHWALNDGKSDVTCFQVPAKITS